MCVVCEMIAKAAAAGGGIPVLSLADLRKAFAAAESGHAEEAKAPPPTTKPASGDFDALEPRSQVFPKSLDRFTADLFARMPTEEREKRMALVEDIFDVIVPMTATLDKETFARLIRDLRGDVTAALEMKRRDPAAFVAEVLAKMKKPPVEETPA